MINISFVKFSLVNIFLISVFFIRCLCNNLNYDEIYEFAAMSHNVYLEIGDKKWINTTLNNVIDISVMENTVKVFLFSNDDKSKNIIAIKGTSVYFSSLSEFSDISKSFELETFKFDNDYKEFSSVSNDKWNDNLFFSCCFNLQAGIKDCVCDANNMCCKSCYERSLEFEKNYLNILQKIMNNVEKIIDINNSELFFTGHSLGGMLASYLGIMYNKLVVSFDAPGDKQYLLLSGIIDNTKYYSNIYHFGHNADPIFVGECGSTCSMIGYYINTKCHVGNTCLYKAKEQLNYTNSIWNHRIDFIIKDIIPHWKDNLPECKQENECTDCDDWVYN